MHFHTQPPCTRIQQTHSYSHSVLCFAAHVVTHTCQCQCQWQRKWQSPILLLLCVYNFVFSSSFIFFVQSFVLSASIDHHSFIFFSELNLYFFEKNKNKDGKKKILHVYFSFCLVSYALGSCCFSVGNFDVHGRISLNGALSLLLRIIDFAIVLLLLVVVC